MLSELKPADLPGDLKEIAEIVGIELAMKLADEIGGALIFWHKWSESGWSESGWSDEVKILVDCVGVENARLLLIYFGGAHVSIPKCAALRRRARDKQIIKKINDGEKMIYIARQYRLTDRRVRQIKRAMKKKLVTGNL